VPNTARDSSHGDAVELPDETDGCGVEAVDRHDQEAECNDPDLVRRQLVVAHEVLDVYGACQRHVPSPCTCLLLS
jgi:hypothetical protein